MEAVGAAASLVALVTVTIQSAKIIHDTLKGIQDATSNVKRCVTAAAQLHSLLSRFTLDGDTAQDEDEKLKELLGDCTQELERIEGYLKKLHRVSDKSRWKNLWTRAKAGLAEKEIGKWSTLIDHYANILGAHLGFLHRDLTIHQGKETNNHMQIVKSDLHTLQDSLDKQYDASKRNEEGMKHHTYQAELALQSQLRDSKRIGSMLESLSGHTKNGVESILNVLRNDIGQDRHTGKKIDDIHEVTAEHNRLLREFLGKFNDFKPHLPTAIGSDDPMKPAPRQSQKDKHAPFYKSIKRLSQYACQGDKTFRVSEARSMIDDIETIFETITAQQKPLLPLREFNKKRKRGEVNEEDCDDFEKRDSCAQALRTSKGILNTTSSVIFNQNATGIIISAKDQDAKWLMASTFQSSKLENGRLDVRSQSRRRRNAPEFAIGVDTDCTGEATIEIFLSKVIFTPVYTYAKQILEVNFMKRAMSNNLHSLSSSISIRRMISTDEEVFAVIGRGDVDGLQKLIEGGTFLPTDCNESGDSLLTYAITSCKLSICRYLVRFDKDVNAIHVDFRGVKRSMLEIADRAVWDNSHFPTPNYITDPERHDCRKLLLELGVDPQFHGEQPLESFFLDRLRFGPVEILRQIFTESSFFIDLEEELDGKTALLHLLGSAHLRAGLLGHICQICLLPGKLALLLKYGSRPATGDESGRNGLFFLLQTIKALKFQSLREKRGNRRRSWYKCDLATHLDKIREALVMLIRGGADIHAIDHDGWSVSDFASASDTTDLWHAALLEHGHDSDSCEPCKPREKDPVLSTKGTKGMAPWTQLIASDDEDYPSDSGNEGEYEADKGPEHEDESSDQEMSDVEHGELPSSGLGYSNVPQSSSELRESLMKLNWREAVYED